MLDRNEPIDEPVLAVEGVTKVFELHQPRTKLWAVRGVTLRIDRGETVALVGETGSGKTTFGRCVLRLEDVTEGTIRLNGTDVTHMSSRVFRPMRKFVQAVFQDPGDSLNPLKTIEHILEEPLRNLSDMTRTQRRARIQESVELVGLRPTVLDRYPRQLTSANQQRVAIARSLVMRPSLIVLDEPTSRLDVSARAMFLSLLSKLQQELGLAYLFISHDLTAVRSISHRIAVMYLGELIESGTTSEIFDLPVHPYTQALLGAVLYPDSSRPPGGVELAGEIPSPTDLPKACPLAPRCPFVQEVCREVRPPIVRVAERDVACHFAPMFADRSSRRAMVLAAE